MTAFTISKKSSIVRRGLCSTALAAGIACVGLTLRTGVTASAAGGGSASETLQRGVTKPSEEINLSFAGPGIIDTVVVKAGDVVKAGQVLATQDAREAMADLEAAKAELDSADLQIAAADADLESKRVELRRNETLYADLIREKKSNSDLDKARVEVTIDEIAVKYRQAQKAQAATKVSLEQLKVEQKKLVSKIDGEIARIDFHPGEGSDLNRPGQQQSSGIQVVRNEPLWVEVDIPSTKAKNLQSKQQLQVKYADEDAWMTAQIIFVTPYASPGSNTRHVRLEMPNAGHREAGLPVVVKLPDNVASAR